MFDIDTWSDVAEQAHEEHTDRLNSRQWRTAKGKLIAIEDMETQHIGYCIATIARKRLYHLEDYIELFAQELIKRSKTIDI